MFKVTQQKLAACEVTESVRCPGSGAVLVFEGTVRDSSRGKKVISVEYDAYEPLAEKKLAEIGAQIVRKWPQAKVAILHRLGELQVGETSLVIAVSSPHRAEAFDACRLAIEEIKKIVPIWKKEVWEGGEYWIEGDAPAGAER